MTEMNYKRTFEAQPTLKTSVRLEPSAGNPFVDKGTQTPYWRMTIQQRKELVTRLIGFIRNL